MKTTEAIDVSSEIERILENWVIGFFGRTRIIGDSGMKFTDHRILTINGEVLYDMKKNWGNECLI